MATRFWYDQQRGCFVFEVSGAETGAQYLQAVRDMFQHPDFKPGAAAVWDLTEADLSSINSTQASANAREQERTRHERGSSRVAIVVRDKFSYGMVRVYLGYGAVEHLDVEIFYSADEAYNWISGH